MNRLFYAKILLFGEYSIILKSDALTIPFTKFNASLRLPAGKFETDEFHYDNSNKNLWSFFAFLKSRFGDNYFNADQFEKELLQGLYLKSDIPVHYGMGSSGALVAAVYDRYFQKKEQTDKLHGLMYLKDLFSQMESFFHGQSSGIDPLSCYMGYPLQISNIQYVNEINLNFSLKKLLHSFFLVDTEIKAETGPLVRLFLEKNKNADFYIKVRKQYMSSVNSAIRAFLEGDPENIRENFKLISAFQLNYMPEMIPEKFKSVWKTGLENDKYYLKLCGSGGGGYLLGISGENTKISDFFEKNVLIQL